MLLNPQGLSEKEEKDRDVQVFSKLGKKISVYFLRILPHNMWLFQNHIPACDNLWGSKGYSICINTNHRWFYNSLTLGNSDRKAPLTSAKIILSSEGSFLIIRPWLLNLFQRM